MDVKANEAMVDLKQIASYPSSKTGLFENNKAIWTFSVMAGEPG